MDEVDKKKVDKLTEGTLIPLSLVIVILGGVTYFTNAVGKMNENTRRIEALENRQERYNDSVNKILERITTIETISRERNGRPRN